MRPHIKDSWRASRSGTHPLQTRGFTLIEFVAALALFMIAVSLIGGAATTSLTARGDLVRAGELDKRISIMLETATENDFASLFDGTFNVPERCDDTQASTGTAAESCVQIRGREVRVTWAAASTEASADASTTVTIEATGTTPSGISMSRSRTVVAPFPDWSYGSGNYSLRMDTNINGAFEPGETATVSVQVNDANADAVAAGIFVDLTSTSGVVVDGLSRRPTGPDGRAEFAITATLNSQPGENTLTASLDTGQSVTGTLTVAGVPHEVRGPLTGDSEPAVVMRGTDAGTVTVTVTDEWGGPVAGEPLSAIAIPEGGLCDSPFRLSPGVLVSAGVSTDAQGNAELTVVAEPGAPVQMYTLCLTAREGQLAEVKAELYVEVAL